MKYGMMGPWEIAHRKAGLPTEEDSLSLAYARKLDEMSVPAIKAIPGYEPRSRFLRAMTE